MQLFGRQQEAPVNTVRPEHPPKLFTRNPAIYFPEVDEIFGMLPGFLENLLVEICSVVLRPRRKPQWVSSSFGSIIFAASWHALVLRG